VLLIRVRYQGLASRGPVAVGPKYIGPIAYLIFITRAPYSYFKFIHKFAKTTFERWSRCGVLTSQYLQWISVTEYHAAGSKNRLPPSCRNKNVDTKTRNFVLDLLD